MKKIEQAIRDFIDNEDIDQGNKDLRNAITTLNELRFAVAMAEQDYPDDAKEVIECLISL